MIKVFQTLEQWRKFRKGDSLRYQRLGFIPTMGALHPGHLALVNASKRENDLTVVSIFVNPTQFNNPKDLKTYPRTLKRDMQRLQQAGADYLLVPTVDEIYPDRFQYRICENNFSRKLCGATRPGHFEGVLTVVMKLLQLVKPHRAYFGEKDYQQLCLIRGMVQAFFMDVEVRNCPTVRETDGLAMSSRNMLLSNRGRKMAVTFANAFASTIPIKKMKTILRQKKIKVEYLEKYQGRKFGAVWVDKVRLIDNVPL